MRIPLVGQAFESHTPISSASMLINLMVEVGSPDGVAPAVLGMTPGLKDFSTLGTTKGDRGLYVMFDELYAVYSSTLYSVDSSGVATDRGTITATSRVKFADNGIQLVIVADSSTYVYNRKTNALITLDAVSGFLEASAVAYVDGYFIFSAKNSNQMFASDLLDPASGEVDFSTFDALKRAQAWTAPGDITHIVTNHREIWVYKSKFVEVWRHTGSTAFPLSRSTGVYFEHGALASKSIVAAYDVIIWLGDDYKVYIAMGGMPTPISTPALEREFFEYGTATDAYAQIWDEGDHKLYGIWFPTANKTWVYDMRTKQWHQRQSFNLGKWRASSVIHAYDGLVVGDSSSANLGELDFDTYEEYGNMIQGIRVMPTIHAEDKKFSIDRLQIRFEGGVGHGAGQGEDPVVALFFSTDYGKTYGTQKNRKLGKVGEYKTTAVWRNQGLYRQCTPKLLITDPVRRYMVDAYAEITVRRV